MMGSKNSSSWDVRLFTVLILILSFLVSGCGGGNSGSGIGGGAKLQYIVSVVDATGSPIKDVEIVDTNNGASGTTEADGNATFDGELTSDASAEFLVQGNGFGKTVELTVQPADKQNVSQIVLLLVVENNSSISVGDVQYLDKDGRSIPSVPRNKDSNKEQTGSSNSTSDVNSESNNSHSGMDSNNAQSAVAKPARPPKKTVASVSNTSASNTSTTPPNSSTQNMLTISIPLTFVSSPGNGTHFPLIGASVAVSISSRTGQITRTATTNQMGRTAISITVADGTISAEDLVEIRIITSEGLFAKSAPLNLDSVRNGTIVSLDTSTPMTTLFVYNSSGTLISDTPTDSRGPDHSFVPDKSNSPSSPDNRGTAPGNRDIGPTRGSDPRTGSSNPQPTPPAPDTSGSNSNPSLSPPTAPTLGTAGGGTPQPPSTPPTTQGGQNGGSPWPPPKAK